MSEKTLYGDRFYPITHEFAFLRSKTSEAVQSHVDWLTPFRQRDGRRLVTRTITGDLASVLQYLPPLTTIERRRMAFVPTKSEWTAYFDNHWPATDTESFASVMSERLRCQGVRVCFQPPRKGVEPATILCVFPPGLTSEMYERTICAAREGRWTWWESGKPYEFEEVERYKLPRIKDRFTHDMLVRYLQHLGIDAFEESFYCRNDEPSWLIEVEGPVYPNMRTLTLEEAQQGRYPWRNRLRIE